MVIQSLDQMAPLFEGRSKIAVCGHVNPDGDCLGSVSALTLVLRDAGFDATALFADDDSKSSLFSFLPGYDAFVDPSDYEGDPDLFVALDTPGADRLGQASAIFDRSAASVAVDHHPDTRDFADLVFTDHTAGAAGILVWDLMKALGLRATPAAATCSYVALLTDTGRFQFQNTDPRCFRYAADFVEAGADPSRCASAIYQNRSMAEMRLETLLLSRMTTSDDGSVAYSYITAEDMAETGASKDDSEGLSDVLRSIRGVQVAVILRVSSDAVRGSLRAKNDEDVGSVARALGGGGHRAAAGFTFHGTVDEALKAVRELLEVTGS